MGPLLSEITSPAKSANTWNHYVCVYDGTNILLYQNGVLVAGPTALARTSVSNGAAVGFSPFTTITLLIDSFGVWNVALNQANVTALYNSGNGLNLAGVAAAGLTTNLVSYYDF